MKDVVWFDMEFVDRLLNTQYQEVYASLAWVLVGTAIDMMAFELLEESV